MRQPHPRIVRAMVVMVAAGIALGASAVIGRSDPETKPGPNPVAEGSSVPGPDDVSDEAERTVAAIAANGRTFSCPTGTHAFHNPVMHYRLCYPQDWGFSDFRSPDPLQQIPFAQLGNLHLLSGEAFPWNVGALPFDEIVAKHAIDVELNVLQSGARVQGECEPTKARSAGDTTVLTCTQIYDALGQPADAGPVTAVKFVVPLLRMPSSDVTAELAGSKLLVIVRTATARALKEADLGWKLVRSIRPY